MPSGAVSVTKKEEIALSLAKHYLIYSTMAELQQLKQGLEELGVLNLLLTHCNLLKPLFLASGKTPLTPSCVVNMFKVIWSPVGSNQREREESVILGWTDYLYGLKGIDVHSTWFAVLLLDPYCFRALCNYLYRNLDIHACTCSKQFCIALTFY